MFFIPSMAFVLLWLLCTSIGIESKHQHYITLRDSHCPTFNIFPFLRCRRRVCLPVELIPLCNDDNDCPTNHKCCRLPCACQVECTEMPLK